MTVEADPFYDYWNDKLDGGKPKMFDGRPQGGFFAMFNGDAKPKSRVRIDRVEGTGEVCIWIDGVAAEPERFSKIWKYCGAHAVSSEAFIFHEQNGRWPDVAAPIVPVGMAPGFTAGAVVMSDHGTFGDPAPAAVHELLPFTVTRITEWLEPLSAFAETDLQPAADHAAALRKLVTEARKLHKAEKDEFLKAGKVIDRKYLDPIHAADAILAKINSAVAKFMDAKRAAEAPPPAPEPTAAPAPPPPAVKIETTMGKTGFKVAVKKFAEVTNQDALYYAIKDDPAVVACLQSCAQRELDSGRELPGVKVVERSVAGGR
jgi:hypothetical protein